VKKFNSKTHRAKRESLSPARPNFTVDILCGLYPEGLTMLNCLGLYLSSVKLDVLSSKDDLFVSAGLYHFRYDVGLDTELLLNGKTGLVRSG
jgi:hypothetical protein